MVTILFGGAGGIGAVLAGQLVKAGGTVILVSRNEERLSSAADETGAQYMVADAGKSAEVDPVFTEVLQKHGRIDAVANCIGSILLKPAHLTSDDEWASTISTNLTTSFHIVRAAVRVMQKQQGGSIVLLASAVARRGMVNHEAIAAARSGGQLPHAPDPLRRHGWSTAGFRAAVFFFTSAGLTGLGLARSGRPGNARHRSFLRVGAANNTPAISSAHSHRMNG